MTETKTTKKIKSCSMCDPKFDGCYMDAFILMPFLSHSPLSHSPTYIERVGHAIYFKGIGWEGAMMQMLFRRHKKAQTPLEEWRWLGAT